MLNGLFYGCRDAYSCLLTNTMYMFVCSMYNLKNVDKAEMNITVCYELCWCELNKKRYNRNRCSQRVKSDIIFLHQRIVHNAIPLLMLIATCTITTAIGNKTGNTKPVVEVNYIRLCVHDFYCPVKCEKQHGFAIIIAPLLVLNQVIINNQF